MEVQERIWFAEHQIRAHLVRGMRPGKAIRRAIPGLTDDELHALVRLWKDGEFSVSFGESSPLWVAAYDSVRSCMQGRGDLCHRAYSQHEVGIAAVVASGEITARGLYRKGRYCMTYGRDSFALGVFLQKIAAMECSDLWMDGLDTMKIVVSETITRKVVISEEGKELVSASYTNPERDLKKGQFAQESITPLKAGEVQRRIWYIYQGTPEVAIYKQERVEIFVPHIDGART